jgi:hypothetical protein
MVIVNELIRLEKLLAFCCSLLIKLLFSFGTALAYDGIWLLV